MGLTRRCPTSWGVGPARRRQAGKTGLIHRRGLQRIDVDGLSPFARALFFDLCGRPVVLESLHGALSVLVQQYEYVHTVAGER